MEDEGQSTLLMVAIQTPRNSFTGACWAKIILADDIENNRKYFKSVLQESSLTIIESQNGLETYNYAEIYKPDLIITDLKMPVLDGFELLKKIKSNSSP